MSTTVLSRYVDPESGSTVLSRYVDPESGS
jgi:hypothetical protein